MFSLFASKAFPIVLFVQVGFYNRSKGDYKMQKVYFATDYFPSWEIMLSQQQRHILIACKCLTEICLFELNNHKLLHSADLQTLFNLDVITFMRNLYCSPLYRPEHFITHKLSLYCYPSLSPHSPSCLTHSYHSPTSPFHSASYQ